MKSRKLRLAVCMAQMRNLYNNYRPCLIKFMLVSYCLYYLYIKSKLKWNQNFQKKADLTKPLFPRKQWPVLMSLKWRTILGLVDKNYLQWHSQNSEFTTVYFLAKLYYLIWAVSWCRYVCTCNEEFGNNLTLLKFFSPLLLDLRPFAFGCSRDKYMAAAQESRQVTSVKSFIFRGV
jgi:hypothetical protein